MEFLKIDGSFGEGGGQIIRSAISLSCLTGKPIEIKNIRKKRRVEGLRPQHLTTIKLLGKLCNAKIEGLEIGSTKIKFVPSKIESKELTENIGTAGSISLIIQAIVPVVSIAQKTLKLSITGGTDVLWSPTSNYTKYVLGEAYSRFGINFQMQIKKRGYYPKGNGQIDLEVYPTKSINSIQLLKRKSKIANILCSYSQFSNTEIDNKISNLQKNLEKNNFLVKKETTNEFALDKGCSMLIYSIDANSIIGVDQILDKPGAGIQLSQEFLDSNLGADNHLSDMLVIPSSFSRENSVFHVKEISSHLKTNLEVTKKIVGIDYQINKLTTGYEVRIKGKSYTGIK